MPIKLPTRGRRGAFEQMFDWRYWIVNSGS
ncbi:hypothetical protein L3Y21_gp106 [Gordonia phage Rabbitrun]|uniref:Uncharacterized protein n=1 Tax=Gordonia phage Rabbitrun TaxID=2762280 RepID=A0A7G8LIV4_9CAUD|nr:hypothetical protein L3Y21_gp106 [Gordonia phage Rabbitrun]QNJ57176.1 hypothetical protein SEA_RABBITRUN_130 [Gordonia phage Rabbitrun]